MQPGTVPRVETVRDDVTRFAGHGQRDDRGDGGVQRWAGREHRCVRRLHARLDLAEAHPHEHPVVVGGVRRPRRAGRASERHAVPLAQHGAVDDVAVLEAGAEVGAGSRPGQHRAVGVAPQHDLAAGDGAHQGAVGRHVARCGCDEPAVGGSAHRRGEGLVDLHGLGITPGAAQVVGRRLGEVAHRHAVTHLLAEGPVGTQQTHPTTLTRAGLRPPDWPATGIPACLTPRPDIDQ